MEVVTTQPFHSEEAGNTLKNNLLTGLGPLRNARQIMLKQTIMGCEEMVSNCFGCDFEKKYTVLDNVTGEIIYWAKETSSCFQRYCCQKTRELNLSIRDQTDTEVISIHRPLRCIGCCCSWCASAECMQEMTVNGPDGRVIATVKEKPTWFTPVLQIMDSTDSYIMKVKGGPWHCRGCWDYDYNVSSPNGDREIGTLTYKFRGICNETFTEADKFIMDFKDDNISVDNKVALLATMFLVDYMYYEKDSQSWQNYGGEF